MDALTRPAFEQLYVQLERPPYNVVYRWVWDASEARDLVQEAFVRLWDMRERVRSETVEPLVDRIALNLASRRRRALRLWRWVGLDGLLDHREPGTDAQGRLELDARERAVRAAVDTLPEKLRQVITLCELGDLSYDAVAETLSIPVGTVGSRRNAALARLRATLEDPHVAG